MKKSWERKNKLACNDSSDRRADHCSISIIYDCCHCAEETFGNDE